MTIVVVDGITSRWHSKGLRNHEVGRQSSGNIGTLSRSRDLRDLAECVYLQKLCMSLALTRKMVPDDTGTAAEDAVGAGVTEMVGRRSSSTRFTKED